MRSDCDADSCFISQWNQYVPGLSITTTEVVEWTLLILSWTFCRSQDDVSIALSVSSCEDDKSKVENKDVQKVEEIPRKTIVIMDEPPVPHPLLMKSLTYSQNDSLRGPMMGKSNDKRVGHGTPTMLNQPAQRKVKFLSTKFDLFRRFNDQFQLQHHQYMHKPKRRRPQPYLDVRGVKIRYVSSGDFHPELARRWDFTCWQFDIVNQY